MQKFLIFLSQLTTGERMALLTERYPAQIDGVLSCYDRIVITGTIPQICYANGMTGYLYQNGVRIFDYPKFAEPLREQLRSNAEELAKANDIRIEFISKKHWLKRFWISAVTLLVWCISSQLWNFVKVTNPGMTKIPVKLISSPIQGNVCITISISSMKSLDFAMFVCQPGVLFVFRFISTDITGWHLN